MYGSLESPLYIKKIKKRKSDVKCFVYEDVLKKTECHPVIMSSLNVDHRYLQG